MNKKILYWLLYDFANSFVLMAFLFYFSQWLVEDQGKPAWWYNLTLIISSILFVVTAPYLSKKIDETKKKVAGLRLWTLVSIITFAGVALVTMLTEGQGLLAAILYTFAMYGYLVCFLYYTPMLNDLSTREGSAWVSGLGQGLNGLGQVVGILATIPFVNGLNLFGVEGRPQALFPAVVFFTLFSLPMVFLYRENHEISSLEKTESGGRAPSIVSLFKSVFSYRPLAFMFAAYFLFSDSLLTFSNNFPLYLQVVFKVSDTTKSILTAAILILAALGAVVFGKVSIKYGGVRVLRWIILAWCVLLLLMAFVTSFTYAIPVFLVAGLLFGPIFSITRALVGQLAPDHLRASSYSYYIVAERFATFIGPALWSIVLVTVGEGVLGYRVGLIALAFVLVISLFIVRKVPEPVFETVAK